MNNVYIISKTTPNYARFVKRSLACLLALLILIASMTVLTYAAPSEDQQTTETEELNETANTGMDSTGVKAIAAAVAIGLAAAAGAIAMGIAISKSSESIARQPEAEEKIRSNLMLGLIFVETAIIYALVVAIMIIFVL